MQFISSTHEANTIDIDTVSAKYEAFCNTVRPIQYSMYSDAPVRLQTPPKWQPPPLQPTIMNPVHDTSTSKSALVHTRGRMGGTKRPRNVLKCIQSEPKPPLKRPKMYIPTTLNDKCGLSTVQSNPKPVRFHHDCPHGYIHRVPCHMCRDHLESDNSHYQICHHCVPKETRMRFSRKPSDNRPNIPRLRRFGFVGHKSKSPVVLPINNRDHTDIFRSQNPLQDGVDAFGVGDALARMRMFTTEDEKLFKSLRTRDTKHTSICDREEYRTNRKEHRETMRSGYPYEYRPKPQVSKHAPLCPLQGDNVTNTAHLRKVTCSDNHHSMQFSRSAHEAVTHQKENYKDIKWGLYRTDGDGTGTKRMEKGRNRCGEAVLSAKVSGSMRVSMHVRYNEYNVQTAYKVQLPDI